MTHQAVHPIGGDPRQAQQRKLLIEFMECLEGSEVTPLERAAIEVFCKWLLSNYSVSALDKNQNLRLDDTKDKI